MIGHQLIHPNLYKREAVPVLNSDVLHNVIDNIGIYAVIM